MHQIIARRYHGYFVINHEFLNSFLNTGKEYPLTYFINLSWLKSQVFKAF
jgi:hypothetical protein